MRTSPVGTSTSPAVRPEVSVVIAAAVIGRTAAAKPAGSRETEISGVIVYFVWRCLFYRGGDNFDAAAPGGGPALQELFRWRSREKGNQRCPAGGGGVLAGGIVACVKIALGDDRGKAGEGAFPVAN